MLAILGLSAYSVCSEESEPCCLTSFFTLVAAMVWASFSLV